jgi:hypothetical protein
MKSSNHTLNFHRLISYTLLYSSSLLFACCAPPSYYCTPADNCLLAYYNNSLTHCPLLQNLFTHEDTARTRFTENVCHMTLCTVVWRHSTCASCAGKKERHIMWPLATVVWCHRGHKENTTSPSVSCTYFGHGLEMASFYCCALEHVAMGMHVTIWRNDASLTLCSFRSQLILKSRHYMYGIVPSWRTESQSAQQEIHRLSVEPRRFIAVFTKAQIFFI